jgi:dihydrolipoamide dehydrogenase
MSQYTVIVMGGGPAGQSAAVRISQLGGKVALVERDYIGGICTNWGCTPSKAMIESAKVARTVAESGRYGIQAKDVKVDFPMVAARRDRVILDTRNSITDLLEHYHVDIYRGEAEITAPGKMIVRKGKLDPDGKTMHYDGGEVELSADNIIIATGSQPLIPGFIDASDPSVVSSNRLISINELPKHLTIIGGASSALNLLLSSPAWAAM